MSYASNLSVRLKARIRLGILLAVPILGLLGYWVKARLYQSDSAKPIGYASIKLPAQRYQSLKGDFPYQFEYSIHAHVRVSTSSAKMDYWIDLYYPAFDATIYISYQSVTDNHLLSKLCKNASILAFKHQVKASDIEESIIQITKGHQAHVIELFGEVPTPFQFYTTDGKKHFLRGALYFKTATQNDRLAPVIAFIKKDMIHMLNTLAWKQ